jgi:hypothetical protein
LPPCFNITMQQMKDNSDLFKTYTSMETTKLAFSKRGASFGVILF